ncbi:MAG: acyltransferase [Clostridiales bacterium]|nr:acyltransferase [Clostridiales bacterium]
MRKYYIDNLRILCIFLLFPFHTTMVFNSFGEIFYVNGTPNDYLTFVNIASYSWWMTGLFVLAGMSTKYALSNRTANQYLAEREHKLLIPAVSSLIFIVPLQTYIADCFHNGYTGSYLKHLKVFLTITDFQGCDGHFSPGHIWFLFYLFLISIVTLPLILRTRKKNFKMNSKLCSIPFLLLIGIVVEMSEKVLVVGNKSFAQFGLCFLIGYFIMSEESVTDRLKKYSIPFGILWALLIISRCVYFLYGEWDSIWNAVLYYIQGWIGVLAMIGLGKRFLDHNWKFTKLFVKAEFPMYLFHQTVIVVLAYWVVSDWKVSVYAQYFVIMVASFVISYGLYLVTRKFRVCRWLFGIKG